MPDNGSRTVYLIASPSLRDNKLPKLMPVLRRKVKGAVLVTYRELFAGPDYKECWQARLRECAGAVVVPSRKRAPDGSGPALWLGEGAVREARYVNGLGHPVLVFVTNGLLPWSAVDPTLSEPEEHPPFLPVLVGIGRPSEARTRDAVTTSEGAA